MSAENRSSPVWVLGRLRLAAGFSWFVGLGARFGAHERSVFVDQYRNEWRWCVGLGVYLLVWEFHIEVML